MRPSFFFFFILVVVAAAVVAAVVSVVLVLLPLLLVLEGVAVDGVLLRKLADCMCYVHCWAV